MKILSNITALSLTIATIGVFSGCQPRQAMKPEVDAEPVAGEAMENPTAGMDVATLNDLEPGFPAGRYAMIFEDLGYMIQDVDVEGQTLIYDLRKPNERALVRLEREEDSNMVASVNVQPLTPVALQTPAVVTVVKEIQAIEPGLRPVEYVPLLDKFGTITEYEVTWNNIEIELDIDGTQYEVEMLTDPATGLVSTIEVEEEIWGI